MIESYLKNLSKEHAEREDLLKGRYDELEKKLLEANQKNVELESRLCHLSSDVDTAKRNNAVKEELSDSISELNKKNTEMETRIRNLQKELEEKNLKKLREKEEEVQQLVEQFDRERQSLIKSYEKKLTGQQSTQYDEKLKVLNKENEDLKQGMRQLQELYQNVQMKLSLEESNESLKSELTLLKDQCNTVSKTIADIHNKDKQELDTLMKENLNLKKEINQLKIKLIKDDNDVPNFKLDLLQVVSENSEIKNEILELKNQMHLLDETLTKERQLLIEYKLKNANLEQHIRKLSSDAKQGQRLEGGSEQRISKKREVGKEDELAWNNLYGIKKVGKKEEIPDDLFLVSAKSEQQVELPEEGKDGIQDYSKIEKLELEFEKTKQEIIRQKLELGFKSEEENKAREIRQSCEMLELKRQLISLQNRMADEKAVRCALENRIAEISVDLRDKQKLELEISSLKRKLDRDFVHKSEMELLKHQKELESKRQSQQEAGDVVGLSADYKQKCEQLARERERSKEIRLKIGRKSNSFDSPPQTSSGPQPKFFSFPRASSHSETLFKSRSFVPASPLEPHLKSKIEDELNKSMLRYTSGEY